MQDLFPGLWDGDLSQKQKFIGLSHPGIPQVGFNSGEGQHSHQALGHNNMSNLFFENILS